MQKQTDDLVRKLKKDLPGLNSVTTQFRSDTPQLFLDIDRTKVASLGVSLDDVNQTLDMYLGSLYVNSFNEFGRHWQVTLQADGNFRNRVEDINLLQVRNNLGQMVPARDARPPARDRRPDLRHPLQPLHRRLGQRQHRAGFQHGRRHQRHRQSAAETLPLSMKADWTELMFMQIRAGNTALYVFCLAVLCVFLALAALYESWTLPLAVILVVPLCLLCSVTGVRLHGPRCQYLRADRPGGAGGAGVQERHPDRRVCQAVARRANRVWRPRRRPRGCGCGRS